MKDNEMEAWKCEVKNLIDKSVKAYGFKKTLKAIDDAFNSQEPVRFSNTSNSPHGK